jgi:hypothetical protein
VARRSAPPRRRVRGRTALLSPFDRLVHDRVRAEELFDFEYTFEVYTPAAKRRWGYCALPILHEDRLVGKADVAAHRKASVLRVNAIHEDVRFTRTMTRAVQAELDELISDPHWRERTQQVSPVQAGLAIQATKDLARLPIAPLGGPRREVMEISKADNGSWKAVLLDAEPRTPGRPVTAITLRRLTTTRELS